MECRRSEMYVNEAMSVADSKKQDVPAPRSGSYRRFFAWLLSRLQNHYGEAIDDRKRQLLGELAGTVVEVGVGAGANFSFYGPEVALIAVEPNLHMYPYLRREAEKHHLGFELRAGTAESMDVESDSADSVVSTLVLCSVDDAAAALNEILRVLKPGGRFVFVEHVAAPSGSRLRGWQRRLKGLWRRIGDGCEPDRETWKAIEAAGFVEVECEHFDSPGMPLVRPHIAGTAKRGLV